MDDQIISKLACDLELDLGRMIDVFPAEPTTIRRESTVSSLGVLDTLPAELLFNPLDLLDFQSLSRVSRTCLRGKMIVEKLSPYQQVMQHAPKVLTALTKTNMISRYPALQVLDTLRASCCVSCSYFGAFLYLPTCERVCFECLWHNNGLWMISLPNARKCFDLSQRQLQSIPIMRNIPGRYSVRGPEKVHRRVTRLVSVRAAKQLAIKVHGTLERITESVSNQTLSWEQSHRYKRYREAPLDLPGCDMSKLPERTSIGNDPFAGVATLRVPYITGSVVDWGHLCKGCQITYQDFDNESLPSNVVSELNPLHTRAELPLFALTTRLYSRHGLVTHAQHCYGAQKLFNEVGGSELGEGR